MRVLNALKLMPCVLLFTGISARAQISQLCSDSRSFDPSRVIVGELDEPNVGRVTLLFCTDKDGNVTSLFLPPKFLQVHEKRNRATGEVQLRSDMFGDGRFYDFEGHKLGEAIVGHLRLKSTKNDAIFFSTDLTLKRASDVLHLEKGGIAKFKHYSNATFIQESGDIIGAEIWFASTKDSAVGFVVFYESYWGEPTMAPLAMEDIHIGMNGMTFNLGIPEFHTYQMKGDSGRATLLRSDQPKSAENRIVLTVSSTLGKYPAK